MSSERLARRTAIRPGAELSETCGLDSQLRFLETDDGHHWDALFVRSPDHPPTETIAVVVHGSVGNYLGGVPRRLAIELARAGVPALTINTRLANFGVIYGGGVFRDAVSDVAAGIDDALALGTTRVALVGYGQGASLVALAQAERAFAEVAALVLVAHPGDPAVAQRERWDRLGAAPSWTAVAATAGARAHDDAIDDIFFVERGSGPTSAPADTEIWTWTTWSDARAPGSAHLNGPRLASLAGVPQLIVQPSTPLAQAAGEQIIRATEAAAGPPARLETIPNTDAALLGRTPDVARRAAGVLAEIEPDVDPPERPRPLTSSAHVVTLRASDGEAHDALLVEDEGASERRVASTGRRTAIVHLHGNQGNFSVGSLRYLPPPIAALGVPALCLETRLANASQIFGGAHFEDALADIGGGIDLLAEHGVEEVILAGYSLGANLAARAVAERWRLPVRGAVLIGAAKSLPDSTRRRMERLGSEPSYDQLAQRCRAAIAASREELLVIRRLYGPSPSPRLSGVYTTSTWWHSRGPEAVDSIADRHLAKAACPVLLVQGTEDTTVDPADASELAGVVRRNGQDAHIAWLEGADHLMRAHEKELVAAVTSWVDEHA